MRLLPALLAVALSSVVLSACGGAGKRTDSALRPSSDAPATGNARVTPASRAMPPGGYLKSDGDTDHDDSPASTRPSQDDESLMAASKFGASQADKRAIATVVKRYYAAAAAGDGTKGCSLLDSTLAAGVTEGQGQPPPGGGRDCAASLSLLFKQQHQQLVADDVSTMVVTEVHVEGRVGLAKLGFRAAPEGEILLQREGGAWKMDALSDSELP